MARHRKATRRVKRRTTTTHRTTTRHHSTKKPRRHRPKVVARPPKKFRVRLDKVEIVTGSELFERTVKGIKEGKERKLRRMGPLGKKIPARVVPKKARVRFGELKKRKKVTKIRVLVKARIKGRLGYFTKTLKFREPRTPGRARKLAKDFIDRISVAYVGSKYEVRALEMSVMFDQEEGKRR